LKQQDRYKKKISENRDYFELSIATAIKMVDNKLYNDAAVYLNGIARFAWDNCTGYYANWQLEGVLNKIGAQINDLQVGTDNKIQRQTGKLNILHVATELYDTGGHTKLLLNWAKNDTTNNNRIVVTQQEFKDLPVRNITSSGLDLADFTFLDNESNFLEKAKQLRGIAKEYDCIILHIHNYDVIPVIAFSCSNLPPVAFLNHSDHIFWLGTSISDLVLQIREANIKLDEKRRNLSNQFFLPIPVPNDGFKGTYTEVRKKLAINDNQVVLLSTGHEYKYRPTSKYNFFEHIIHVLDAHAAALLFIAGIGPASDLAKKYAHDRIIYLGHVNDLYKYETACDIYVEGFPFPSFTAMLQPGIKGKPIQLMYEPMPVVAFFTDNTLGFEYPAENAWGEDLGHLIESVEKRSELVNKQQQHFNTFYGAESWSERLNCMYKKLILLKHTITINIDSIYFETPNEYYLASISHNTYITPFSFKNKQANLLFKHAKMLLMRTKYKYIAQLLYSRLLGKQINLF
jgi:hypothetical protein